MALAWVRVGCCLVGGTVLRCLGDIEVGNPCKRPGPWLPDWMLADLPTREDVSGELDPGVKLARAPCSWGPGEGDTGAASGGGIPEARPFE